MTKISIFNKQRTLKMNKKSVESALLSCLAYHQVACDEISVYFISDKEMIAMHEEFFDDPTPTDCISFPYEEDQAFGYHYLGDIFVCPNTAKEYILKNGGDLYEETTLYLVHAFLHLIGYKDIKPEDRKIMKKEERKLLNDLKTKKLLIHA